MRIDAYNAISQLYQVNSTPSVKKTGSVQSFSDKLEFSQTARSFATTKKAVSEAPDVRMDKIMQIKAQMEAGSYHVSSEAIADKILNNADTLTF